MSRRDEIRDKILARCTVDPVTGCWLWQGPTSGKTGRGAGYGRMSLDGATVATHKAMWTNEHGLIPPRKELDHVCRNRLCCNPDNDKHVEMVTRLENARRRDAAALEDKVCISETF